MGGGDPLDQAKHNVFAPLISFIYDQPFVMLHLVGTSFVKEGEGMTEEDEEATMNKGK